MKKKLSVVIPTLNRYEYLRRTIQILLPQISRNQSRVELVVCTNACTDKTDQYMKSLITQFPYLVYKKFDEYVEVGASMARSVNQCTGEYVILWGDDDVAYPYFIDYILQVLAEYEDVGVIHLNRLQGKDTKYGLKELKVVNRIFENEFIEFSLEDLIQSFTLDLGFISSLVFKHKIWDDGKDFFSPTHYGYEFLAIIMNGAKKQKCLYCNLPVEIQRNPFNRDYSAKWPLYALIGVPNMMSDFDKWGITKHAFDSWNKAENRNTIKFIWNLLYTTEKRKFYKPLCCDINKYQHCVLRKILTYLIVFLFPRSVFRCLKKSLYR